MARKIVDRWRFGQPPSGPPWRPFVSTSLRNLERTLDLLHPAIEGAIQADGITGISPQTILGGLTVEDGFIVNDLGDDHDSRFEGATDANLLFLDASTDRVGIGTATPGAKIDVRGAAIFNEDGGDFDFRVEGDNNINLLFVDASTDRVGLGLSTPQARLDVQSAGAGLDVLMATSSDGGTLFRVQEQASTAALLSLFDASASELIRFSTTGDSWFNGGNLGIGVSTPNAKLDVRGSAIFNEAGADVDFRVEGDTQVNLLFIDASTDRVGIGTATPGALLDVRGAAIFNEDGADVDFRVEGVGASNALFVDGANGSVGVGTGAPSGLQVSLAVAESVRGVDNVRLGVASGTPRVIFEDSGFTQWQIDNSAGAFRWFTPGVVRMSLSSTGNLALPGALGVDGGAIFNELGADVDLRVEGDTLPYMIFCDATSTTENIALLTTAAPNWQTMDIGLFIGNTATAPTGNPTGGGYLYVVAGALTWRGSAGTITTLGAA